MYSYECVICVDMNMNVCYVLTVLSEGHLGSRRSPLGGLIIRQVVHKVFGAIVLHQVHLQ
jgi:hypothetical protein